MRHNMRLWKVADAGGFASISLYAQCSHKAHHACHGTERLGLSISPAARNSNEIEASTKMVDRYLAPCKKSGTSVLPEVKSFRAWIIAGIQAKQVFALPMSLTTTEKFSFGLRPPDIVVRVK